MMAMRSVDRTEQRDRRVLHIRCAACHGSRTALMVRHDVLEDFAEVEQLPISRRPSPNGLANSGRQNRMLRRFTAR